MGEGQKEEKRYTEEVCTGNGHIHDIHGDVISKSPSSCVCDTAEKQSRATALSKSWSKEWRITYMVLQVVFPSTSHFFPEWAGPIGLFALRFFCHPSLLCSVSHWGCPPRITPLGRLPSGCSQWEQVAGEHRAEGGEKPWRFSPHPCFGCHLWQQRFQLSLGDPPWLQLLPRGHNPVVLATPPLPRVVATPAVATLWLASLFPVQLVSPANLSAENLLY